MRKLFYSLVSVVLFLSCAKHYVKTKNSFAHQPIRDEKSHQITDDSISKYKTFVDAETNRVLVKSDDVLVKEGAETTLGNFVCDALQHYAGSSGFGKADIVILNRGGLRSDLPAGNIIVKNIFELMPFENEVVILTVKGKDLLSFASILSEKKHPFKGIYVLIDKGIATVSYNGKPIALDDEFTVITSDYLANGGDSFSFFANAIKREGTGKLVRSAIIEYCDHINKNGMTIKPYRDGRLEISK